ncbi:hypothetical protein RFI_39996 [Reticulomyxa filosa]|uniref:Uncharacterized protein n=1 Tax=Reticulomyxa filosa TaxID=46433 RepID=X6L819_RETFI|nr:hypothetical protein RFI_39996 [Reticulomyxa filosa]|eukprot:ETN97533.1 hypothetical protein RFI_39996 [Reticulomyxa filosa]
MAMEVDEKEEEEKDEETEEETAMGMGVEMEMSLAVEMEKFMQNYLMNIEFGTPHKQNEDMEKALTQQDLSQWGEPKELCKYHMLVLYSLEKDHEFSKREIEFLRKYIPYVDFVNVQQEFTYLCEQFECMFAHYWHFSQQPKQRENIYQRINLKFRLVQFLKSVFVPVPDLLAVFHKYSRPYWKHYQVFFLLFFKIFFLIFFLIFFKIFFKI